MSKYSVKSACMHQDQVLAKSICCCNHCVGWNRSRVLSVPTCYCLECHYAKSLQVSILRPPKRNASKLHYFLSLFDFLIILQKSDRKHSARTVFFFSRYDNFHHLYIACASINHDQQLSSPRPLSAQTRHRTHRSRAAQQSSSAQPGAVRGVWNE